MRRKAVGGSAAKGGGDNYSDLKQRIQNRLIYFCVSELRHGFNRFSVILQNSPTNKRGFDVDLSELVIAIAHMIKGVIAKDSIELFTIRVLNLPISLKADIQAILTGSTRH